MSTLKEQADAARELLGAMRVKLTCECRCQCHIGLCAREISLDTLDCDSGCRSTHLLAAGCLLDGGRGMEPSSIATQPLGGAS